MGDPVGRREGVLVGPIVGLFVTGGSDGGTVGIGVGETVGSGVGWSVSATGGNVGALVGILMSPPSTKRGLLRPPKPLGKRLCHAAEPLIPSTVGPFFLILSK